MSQLVTKDYAVRVIVQPAQHREPATFRQIAGARNGERLRVEIDGRLRVLLENASRAPIVQILRRPRIDVEGIGVGFAVTAQNDPHQIVGAFFVVLALHLRRDLVVGLGDNVFQADLVWIIAKGLKGKNLCHLRKAGLPGRAQGAARTARFCILSSGKRKTDPEFLTS